MVAQGLEDTSSIRSNNTHPKTNERESPTAEAQDDDMQPKHW